MFRHSGLFESFTLVSPKSLIEYIERIGAIFAAFLSILDNIELTGGKTKQNLDTISEDKIMKGIKKALPIVDQQVYGRAFIY
jgi:hypothetical protein